MKKFKAISLVVFMLALAVLIASGISRFITLSIVSVSAVSKVQIGNVSYYAVSAGKKSSREEVSELEHSVSTQGGAGFVYESGENFYVLTSAYAKKSEAESVIANIKEKYKAAEIVEIKLQKINFTIENDSADKLKNADANLKSCVSYFISKSVSLDKGEITSSEILIELLKFMTKFDSDLVLMENEADESFINLKILLKSVKLNLQALNINENFNQNFKFIGLNILVSMQNYYIKLA